MNKRKEDYAELLHSRKDYYDSFYSNSSSIDHLDDNDEDLLSSEHFVKHLMPVNSKNLFVFLFLLVVMNLGLAILVLVN